MFTSLRFHFTLVCGLLFFTVRVLSTPVNDKPPTSLLPPLVVSAMQNGRSFETFDQLEEESRPDGYSSDAIGNMSASVTSGFNLECSKLSSVPVLGNLNCLQDFWDFQEFQPKLEYKKFESPVSQRDACRYTIGFKECTPGNGVTQTVAHTPEALTDGDPNTVWAEKIAGSTEINIDLHGTFEVIALALYVETIPLDVTVTLIKEGRKPVVAAKLKQKCDDEDEECQEYLYTVDKELVISWDLENESDMVADVMRITLAGVTDTPAYKTNYYVIKDIRVLAKPVRRTSQDERRRKFVHALRMIAKHNLQFRRIDLSKEQQN